MWWCMHVRAWVYMLPPWNGISHSTAIKLLRSACPQPFSNTRLQSYMARIAFYVSYWDSNSGLHSCYCQLSPICCLCHYQLGLKSILGPILTTPQIQTFLGTRVPKHSVWKPKFQLAWLWPKQSCASQLSQLLSRATKPQGATRWPHSFFGQRLKLCTWSCLCF